MSSNAPTNGEATASTTEPVAPDIIAAPAAPPPPPTPSEDRSSPVPPPSAPADGGSSPPRPPVSPSVRLAAFRPATLFTPNGQPVSASAIPVWLVLFAVAVVLGLYFGGFIVVAPASVSAANGPAILAIVTGAAVVIERVLEAFWTYVDSRVGAWWPFSIVHDAINRLVDVFDRSVEPYLNRLRFARDAIAAAQQKDGEWKSDVNAILEQVNAVPDQLKKLAATLKESGIANDQKVAILAESASNSITDILNTYPDLQKYVGADVDLAQALTDDVNSFLNTFNDNPARRSISLLVGCIAGYAIAIGLKLDMFAVLGVPTAIGGLWSAGVPLTGLVIGLGSNPTHEVIQAIQQFKQAKQSEAAQSS